MIRLGTSKIQVVSHSNGCFNGKQKKQEQKRETTLNPVDGRHKRLKYLVSQAELTLELLRPSFRFRPLLPTRMTLNDLKIHWETIRGSVYWRSRRNKMGFRSVAFNIQGSIPSIHLYALKYCTVELRSRAMHCIALHCSDIATPNKPFPVVCFSGRSPPTKLSGSRRTEVYRLKTSTFPIPW